MSISVIISTYNGEKYIEEQMESIRNQSLQPDEVLIFDDCSSDSTVNVVNEFIKQNGLQQWKISVNDKNKGWRKNFIDGIKLAHGDIIFLADQDDKWRSDKIERMKSAINENEKIQLLVSNYKSFYDDGSVGNIGPRENDKTIVKINNGCKLTKIEYPGCTYCFRKSFAEEAVKFWREGYAHDALLWQFAYINDGLYCYLDDLMMWRRHKDSTYQKELVHSRQKERKIDGFLFDIDTFTEFLGRLTNKISGDKTADLEKNIKWLRTRIKFYRTQNAFTGVEMLRYLNCYPRKRQYVLDWMIAFQK